MGVNAFRFLFAKSRTEERRWLLAERTSQQLCIRRDDGIEEVNQQRDKRNTVPEQQTLSVATIWISGAENR